MELNWMAWTWQTGVFFAGIASLLLILTLLAVFRPETERVGVLGIATTRGDRLFISLLEIGRAHV
jgi:predicted small integral membrane protein